MYLVKQSTRTREARGWTNVSGRALLLALRPWRRLVSFVIVILSRLGGHLDAIGSAGQLGPDPDTELSRWTGARI